MVEKINELNTKTNLYLKNKQYKKVEELLINSKFEALKSKEYMVYTSSLILLLNTYNLMDSEIKMKEMIDELYLFLDEDNIEKNMVNTEMYLDTGNNLYNIGFVSLAFDYFTKCIEVYSDSLDQDFDVFKGILEDVVPCFWIKEDYYEIINLNEMFINTVGEDSYEYHFSVLAASAEIVKALNSIDVSLRDDELLLKYLLLAYNILMSIPIEDTDVFLIAKSIHDELEYRDMTIKADNINNRTVEYFNSLLDEAIINELEEKND